MLSEHSVGERLFSVSRTAGQPSCDQSVDGQTSGATSFETQRNSRNNNNNKSQNRQRQPALFIQGDSGNSRSSMSSSPASTAALKQTPAGGHHSTTNVIPIVVPRQSGNYWCQYPSESEFDTTRINSYLSAISLSRRNGGSSAVSGGKQMRSRSVDAPLNRLRMSLHKPVSSLLSAISSPVGAKIIASTGGSSSGSSGQSRAVLVTRSESLNSEGSSLSGESGLCEFAERNHNNHNHHNNHLHHHHHHHHRPAKSVLKKTNQTTTVHLNPGKKNVTFSAYATIQVMDG